MRRSLSMVPPRPAAAKSKSEASLARRFSHRSKLLASFGALKADIHRVTVSLGRRKVVRDRDCKRGNAPTNLVESNAAIRSCRMNNEAVRDFGGAADEHGRRNERRNVGRRAGSARGEGGRPRRERERRQRIAERPETRLPLGPRQIGVNRIATAVMRN